MVDGNGERGTVIVVAAKPGATRGYIDALRERGIAVLGPYTPPEVPQTVSRIDCAVIDLSEPDGELQKMFGRLSRALAPAVLIITALEDHRTRIDAAWMGVFDGVVAPYNPEEVIARVEILLAKRRRARREIVQAGDLVLQPAERRLERNGTEIELTPREFDVLLALVRARGRAVSKQELLREVWHDEHRNANAVEAHVSALRRKLDAAGPPVIHTVHRAGYAFRPASTNANANATRNTLLAERSRLLQERDEAFARRDELLSELHRRLRGD